MSPRYTSPLTGSQVFEADARTIAPRFAGTASLAILDGPYGLGKAAWDRVPRGGTLADLYQGALDDVGTVCLPSASLYLWNTAAGWAELHPHVLARGWTFRALITWDKGVASMAGKVDTAGLRTWFDVTEVCGFYQREQVSELGGPAQFISYAAGASPGNSIRLWLHAERARSGLTGDQLEEAVNEAGGKGTMVCRHSFIESQWCMPTFDQWKSLHAAWNRWADPAGRPYLQRAERGRVWDTSVGADHEALRAEYEALRAPFTCPLGVGNVWTQGQVSGVERLSVDGNTLHPCQKPILFAERMIRASTRPGDTVWSPYGGTLRELVAAERMARLDPADARKVITCELNQDGKDYIGAALEQIGAEVRPRGGQIKLFGGAR